MGVPHFDSCGGFVKEALMRFLDENERVLACVEWLRNGFRIAKALFEVVPGPPEEELTAIKHLKNREVLLDCEPYQFLERNGVILVYCQDGARSIDSVIFHTGSYFGRNRFFSWFRRAWVGFLWFYLRAHPQIHLHGWHGGPPRMVKGCAANMPRGEEHETFIHELLEAIVEVQQIFDVDFLIHSPCGKRKKHKISIQIALELAATTKRIIKLERYPEYWRSIHGSNPPELRIRICLQIDYGKKWWGRRKKRTLYVPSHRIGELAAEENWPLPTSHRAYGYFPSAKSL